MTREEWQAEKNAEHLRTGAWGFDPGMPWHVAKWHERFGIVFFHGFMWGVVLPAMFVGALLLLGTMVDGISRHNSEHNRCLQKATNGYEIKQCR